MIERIVYFCLLWGSLWMIYPGADAVEGRSAFALAWSILFIVTLIAIFCTTLKIPKK